MINPAGIYLLKVNNRNTRTRCETCSKLTIKTQVLLWVNFEQVNTGWECYNRYLAADTKRCKDIKIRAYVVPIFIIDFHFKCNKCPSNLFLCFITLSRENQKYKNLRWKLIKFVKKMCTVWPGSEILRKRFFVPHWKIKHTDLTNYS